MNRSLKLAVVGHSNVGKTSLVSALIRDANLEVREEPGTTRTRYSRAFAIDDEPVVAYIDTPGFETAGRINKWLDAQADGDADEPTLVERFLDEAETDGPFRQEKEALRGAMEADALAYVADVTDPPTGQQQQELRLLRRTGVPMLAVFNVLGPDDERAAWIEALRRRQIDVHVELDAHAFPAAQEEAFYAKVAVLRSEWADQLERVVRLRRAQAQRQERQTARIVADLLVDSLSFRHVERHGTKTEGNKHRDGANEAFKRQLRNRERAAFQHIAELYGFDAVAIEGGKLGVDSWSGTWQGDLFDPEQLKRYGLSIGTLAGLGALAGSPLDGVSGPGVGTGIGAIVGAGAGWWLGRRVSTTVDSRGTLTVGPVDATQFSAVLAHRALELWVHVRSRSHARRDAISLNEAPDAWEADADAAPDRPRLTTREASRLKSVAKRCRKNAEWSHVDRPQPSTPKRDSAAAEAEEILLGAMKRV